MHQSEKEFRDLIESWKTDPQYVAEGIAFEVALAINGRLKAVSMTQKMLAEQINVSPGRISQVLGGNANLTLLSLARIALGVGLTPSVSFAPVGESAVQIAWTSSSVSAMHSSPETPSSGSIDEPSATATHAARDCTERRKETESASVGSYTTLPTSTLGVAA